MNKPKEYQCKVLSSDYVTPTVFLLKFETLEPLDFIAGQFASIIIPGRGPGGRDLRRAYSIASLPGQTPIELCIKFVEGGAGTTYLKSLKPGETFRASIPFGDFVYKAKENQNLCFIATGTGVAPFRSIAGSVPFKNNPPSNAICLFGVRTEDEILYEDELSGNSKIQWIPCVSAPTDQWKGFRGRVSQFLKTRSELFDFLKTDFYLCGNGEMIKEVKDYLLEKGTPKECIRTEKYY